MALELNDIKFFKSQTVTDTDSNGGRMDETREIPNGVKYNLFPRVTYQERINGYTRYRKEFMANRNADNEVAYGALYALLAHFNGQDRFYIRPGTQTDTQANIAGETDWYGGGKLFADVAAGATEVQIEFQADDYTIPNDANLVVAEYDSVNDEFINTAVLKTANNQYTGESIGSGDGSTTSFSHTLAHPPILKNSLTLHYTIGGTAYTATDDGNGNLTGDHISGTINYETGELSFTFDTAPDNGTDITADYTERCHTWSGNVATIKLSEQVPRDYSASNSYAGIALELGDLKPEKADITVNSANGTFDDSQLSVNNRGTVYDEWTITFIDATTFQVSGVHEGSLPNGSINSEYAPVNPRTGQPYFRIETAAWGGSWQAGESVVFKTYPAAKAIWWKEVIPAGTPREPQNKAYAHWLVE